MNRSALLFGLKCALAAIAAAYVALQFQLPNPFWAVVTSFIVSRPILGGAVWALAGYRALGTVIGVAVAMLIIPNLIDAPALMMLALAGWVGLCVYLSLLDRTARSYAFALAGYTATLIALPTVNDAGNIFNVSVARLEEILIGVASAALVHNVIFPRSIDAVLTAKLGRTLADAKSWIAGALNGESPQPERAARRRLAADVSELQQLADALRFEPHGMHASATLVGALEERLVALLPLLAAVDDRIAALSASGGLPPQLAALVADARAWIQDGGVTDRERTEALLQACADAAPRIGPESSWADLLALNVVQRLSALVRAFRDAVEVSEALRERRQPAPGMLASTAGDASRRKLHIDHGIALWSGLAAGGAFLICIAFSMAIEWPRGIASAAIAAILCSLFAGFDDPSPVLQRLVRWALISVPVAWFYVFVAFPAIDGFAELAIVLFPLFMTIGAFLAMPQHLLRALAVALVANTLIGLQPTYQADFGDFLNFSIAAVLGAIVALMVTRLARVISAELASRRILGAGWSELADLAGDGRDYDRAQFATRMLDRLGLLTPRLAQARNVTDLQLADALRDLQIGINLGELIAVAEELPAAFRQRLADLRRELAAHFEALSAQPTRPLSASLRAALDALTPALLDAPASPAREQALVAAVGLKQSLPGAPTLSPAGATS